MHRTVPLSQFMPYGAPDLLAAAPERLTRAVMASSALAVAAFVFALLVAPHWATHEAPRVVPVPSDRSIDAPPSILVPRLPPPPTAPARPRAAPDEGAVQPRPDNEVQPTKAEDAPPGRLDGNVKGDVDDRAISPPGPPPEEPLPERGRTNPVDEMPVAFFKPKPDYPPIPREAGIEGLVVVHVLVGKEGRVLKAEIDEKRSIPMLNAAAEEAARRWLFKPAFTNGKPVPVWVVLSFRFTLH